MLDAALVPLDHLILPYLDILERLVKSKILGVVVRRDTLSRLAKGLLQLGRSLGLRQHLLLLVSMIPLEFTQILHLKRVL